MINKIREDKKSCADHRRPFHVLLELTLKVKSMKRQGSVFYHLKDLSYCCDERFRGLTQVLDIEKYCCGTAFAVCDDAVGYSYPPKLRCCGNPKQSKRESNCGAFTDSTYAKTIEQELEQNRMFVGKKSGKWAKDIQTVPTPATDGYGFCHYVHAGRFDVTKDLSRNPGSDIFGLCKNSQQRESLFKKIKCPEGKKFMYQFQDDTNICCTKGSHMHESDDELIHRDCCINNFSPGINKMYVNPMTKYGTDHCKTIVALQCCSGMCKKPTPEGRDNNGNLIYGIDGDVSRCQVKHNDTFIYCGGDYLFDVSDPDYVKASAGKA
jgi:hypothetical protein